MQNAAFIEVRAKVRYWEDAYVNGIEDADGALIPCKKGESWEPVIGLEDGAIAGWPEGTEADVHFKVCDAGEYWLLDDNQNRIAKWNGDYVPNDILCVNDNGYGDYIIFKIAACGKIVGWKQPGIDVNQWSMI